jgi:hypothetical protein
MPRELLTLLALGGWVLISGGLIVGLRWRDQRRRDRDRELFLVTWPRDVAPEAALAFLTALAGLPRQRWPHLGQSTVAIETLAEQARIEHRLRVPRGQSSFVLGQLRAHVPGARTEPLASAEAELGSASVELRLTDPLRELRTDGAEGASSALLASLQPLSAGERVVVQWVIGPGVMRPVPEPVRGRQVSVIGRTLSREVEPPEERTARQAARTKQTAPILHAVGRVEVEASTRERSGHLLWRVMTVLRSVQAPGVTLRRRLLPQGWIARRAGEARTPLLGVPARLNARELLAVLGWPLAGVQSAALSFAGGRQLPPSGSIPTRGRVIGEATYPGAERPVAVSVRDSLLHLHVIGPTGVGKSTILCNLILQDLAAGRGAVVLDTKGDLLNDVLDRVPPRRLDDVVVLDPTDELRPVGLNPLARSGDAELIADQVVGTLHRLYAAFWGPRTQDILHASLLTLASRPGLTLCELPVLLTNLGFRRELVATLHDDVALKPFWAWYESLSDGERTQALGPVMNKLRAFLLRRRLRNVIGQAEPRFSVSEVLERKKVLLVSLAKGVLGSEAASLLGSLVVAQCWQAIQSRAAISPEQRAPVFVYLDEFQDYLALPLDLADVLAQARGFGVGLVLAHQHLGQLPAHVRQAVLGNARSRVVFQTSTDDAAALARALGRSLSPDDLQDLPAFEAYARLCGDGQATDVCSLRTLPLPHALGTASDVRERSRQSYGHDRAEIEAAIRARRSMQTDAPVGRRRRTAWITSRVVVEK